MKRKLAWLAVPLLLAAGIFGVKWRAEHPMPTKEDLAIRAVLLKSRSIYFSHGGLPGAGEFDSIWSDLNQSEAKLFIECLYLLPKSKQNNNSLLGGIKGNILIRWSIPEKNPNKTQEVTTLFRVAENDGLCLAYGSNGFKPYFHQLHPVTVKIWMELLLANPRIGPELRARMK